MKKFRFIGPFIADVIVGQLGLSYGTEQCKKEIEHVLNETLAESVSSDMAVKVKALEKFRLGQPEKGIELLESTLDKKAKVSVKKAKVSGLHI